MTKCRAGFATESQLALRIQEQELALPRQNLKEKTRLEQMCLQEKAKVTVAKIAAIEDELAYEA